MSGRALAGRMLPRVALGAAAGLLLSQLIVIAAGDRSGFPVGMDVQLYLEATQRWLGGGPFYPEYQVAGPYTIHHGAILYPPPILLLLVPFTFLPLVLWWTVPLGVIAWALWRLRPSVLAWAGIVAALAAPATIGTLVNGNPVIWATAALALGTLYSWPAVFTALKVSIAPFALFGCWHRSWWLAAASGLLVSLAFLPMWRDYVPVLLNSSNPRGLLYSVADVPLVMIPLMAWLGRQRHGVGVPAPRRWRVGRVNESRPRRARPPTREVLPADGTFGGRD